MGRSKGSGLFVLSSLLKRAEIYPDSTGGSDQIMFAYNRQSQVTTMVDQGGTTHIYDYDKLGRQTQDRVTAGPARTLGEMGNSLARVRV